MLRVLAFVLVFFTLAPTYAWQVADVQQIEGAVVNQKKYSIVVATAQGDFEVAIPDSVAVERILVRPRFDWEGSLIRCESNPTRKDTQDDEEQAKPAEISIDKPMFIEGWFAHRNEFERLWGGNKKSLVRYRLTNNPRPPQQPSDDDLRLFGQIMDIDERNEASLQIGDDLYRVRLGDREAFCSGFSILDLRPEDTEVSINVEQIDGRWVAQRVRFRVKPND